MNNKYMIRKLLENRKRRKKVETGKDDTTEKVDKWRQLMKSEENYPCSSNGTTSIIIPHASVPGNCLIIEIQSREADNRSGTNSINANEKDNIKKILGAENRKGNDDQVQDQDEVDNSLTSEQKKEKNRKREENETQELEKRYRILNAKCVYHKKIIK